MIEINNSLAFTESTTAFHIGRCNKMLEIAKELGVTPTRIFKHMHSRLTLKRMEKEGFPLPDQVFIMQMAICLELKYMDSQNHMRDKSVPCKALETKFLQEMCQWELNLTYGELCDYLESNAYVRQKVPVNKLTAAWHKLLHMLK